MTMSTAAALALFFAVVVVTYLFVSTFNDKAETVYSSFRLAWGGFYLVLIFLAILTFITSGSIYLVGVGMILAFFATLWVLLDHYSPVQQAKS